MAKIGGGTPYLITLDTALIDDTRSRNRGTTRSFTSLRELAFPRCRKGNTSLIHLVLAALKKGGGCAGDLGLGQPH